MSSEGQEALQEARIELQKLKLRERKLAEENRVILSTISAISKAGNISEIFYSLEYVLKKYIKFDDFIVVSRVGNDGAFKTLLTNNKVFEQMNWNDCGKLSRVINGECAILFEPKSLGEFNSLHPIVLDQINSVLITGLDSGLTQSVIIFIHSNTKHFSIETKATLNRFRPLIERAVFDIENKEKLEATVRERTAELVNARKEAEEANKAKSEFLAMMSHELRTPLNAIIGLIDTLKSTELTQEQQSILLNMSTSSELLLAIISDVLDFSKIESGCFSLAPQWNNVRDTVTFVLSEQRKAADSKGLALTVTTDIPEDELHYIDQSRLAQILFNLIGNAIKFTECGHVHVSIKYQQSSFNITVEDSGIGISAQQLSSLFSPFVQADSTITRRFGGTGLGLAITKRLVELMRGRIFVNSELGQGSKFEVQLPVSTRVVCDKTNRQNELQIQEEPRSRYSVLVVEDNPTNQMVIKLILTRQGHDVFIASNGAEAIGFIEQGSDAIDIILMDVSMPVMDGLTTTKYMRDANIQTPIVALTAHTSVEDRFSCLDVGMNDFVTKPVRTKEITEAIDRLMLEV
ncbi:hybrid sensor histidine kinase/response regulator [Vibrio lentus]|uniref:histidine kinase n=3 Tax=Vibrio lentus TaxID=136468 RepID=A0A4U2B9E8_9VIBR|nr:ATP-binding protein [Vibrio lentus]PHN83711.1 hybrid sensor histidine kinase/response regulator [Vibrio splendidus]MCC4783854.1 response regulator [Vibrio lentus]PME57089.1 hybrid sensor histidine kinase/response regulator [Vibrio lentus]PMG46895.1 hybrid sensor histidine kinase/response regulator [Vibrio lentus]PMJ07411.1 hybrid sensor histidine kinase/response regulator [Vibrio lentus]